MTVAALDDRLTSTVALLRAGGVVAFPTETVYGLGADVSNPAALRRVFEIKGRPTDHPLIVHIAAASELPRWAREVPEQAWRLAEEFWPGPLTLILPRSECVSDSVTGGQDTVGLRVPDHPLALALLKALAPEKALAAPSANRFGRVSPTSAAHVCEELGDAVDMILDGGSCEVGLESTIVGFTGETAVILRPGGIPLGALAKVLDGSIAVSGDAKRAMRVPGSLSSHYSPATPLELQPCHDLVRRAFELEASGLRIALMGWSSEYMRQARNPENIKAMHFPMPAEPLDYGRKLYATLRFIDHQNFDHLLVEAPPDEPDWMAVADRLRRASSVRDGQTDHNVMQAGNGKTHEVANG
jgi:L-threonylcarbamoyladenylate synthase